MPKQTRPACPSCGRKVALSGADGIFAGVCYDCKSKPPKFHPGDRASVMVLVDFIVFTVHKLHYSLDYGWEYSFAERKSWRMSEKNLREASKESEAQNG